jgi:AbrB family looped-hinge helix DNA binding protein
MELVKLSKKGQVNIPRRVLSDLGVPAGSMLIVETTADGAIVLRPAAVSPIEIYDDERLAEFAEMDRPTAAELKRFSRKAASEHKD